MFFRWLWTHFQKTERAEAEKVANVKLVVGLGNPGRKYAETRHNVGFQVVAELARRHALGRARSQFRGETVDANIRGSDSSRLGAADSQVPNSQASSSEGTRLLLLCPDTYMNQSGSSVLAARDFYKTPDSDLLLVCDDFNLPFGQLRVRAKGSSGGQRGLEDVIRRLGTSQFARLRIGIGEPPAGWDVADYVLSKFDHQERSDLDRVVQRAADAVAVWALEGTTNCMNQFNSRA